MGVLLINGMHTFSQGILVPRLSDCGFRTKRGKEFEKDFAAKLNALIGKYKKIYDI